MIILYWCLSVTWIITISITVSYYILKPSFRSTPIAKKLLKGFLVLGTILTIDSLYWAIATTARVNVFSADLASFFYNDWAVSTIKLVFLFSAITFLIILINTFKEVDFQVEKLYFSQFVEQSIDAIGVLDTNGRVLYWNSGAEKLYGHKRDNVLSRQIKEFLVPRQYYTDIDRVIKKIKKTQKAERFIAPRLRADNTEIMVDITMSPFFVDNKLTGFFGIMRPIADVNSSENKFIPIKLEELHFYDLSTDDSNSIIQQITNSFEDSHTMFNKRKKLAIVFVSLLFILSIVLIVLSIVCETKYKLILGSSSILSLLGEIFPLKFLLKDTQIKDDIKADAMKRILKNCINDASELDRALEVYDNIMKRVK